jgi:hypothetical protein
MFFFMAAFLNANEGIRTEAEGSHLAVGSQGELGQCTVRPFIGNRLSPESEQEQECESANQEIC